MFALYNQQKVGGFLGAPTQRMSYSATGTFQDVNTETPVSRKKNTVLVGMSTV